MRDMQQQSCNAELITRIAVRMVAVTQAVIALNLSQ